MHFREPSQKNPKRILAAGNVKKNLRINKYLAIGGLNKKLFSRINALNNFSVFANIFTNLFAQTLSRQKAKIP